MSSQIFFIALYNKSQFVTGFTICTVCNNSFILPSPSAHGHTDAAQVHLLSYTCGKNDVFIGCKIEMTPVSPAHRLCAGCKIGPVDFETKKR